MSSIMTVLSSMATRKVLGELARSYEQRTGHRVKSEAIGGIDAERRVRNGAAADIVILASKVIEQLEVEGHLAPGCRRNFASSRIAVAVRSGEARPSIHDEERVKQAILGAPRIGYSTGPSGDHLKQLWERWGVASSVSRRAVQAPPGVSVGALIAQGEVDLGFQQLSELLDVPGIDVLGTLPPDLQGVTVFSMGLSSNSLGRSQACDLVEYLSSPEADEAKRRNGMEPA